MGCHMHENKKQLEIAFKGMDGKAVMALSQEEFVKKLKRKDDDGDISIYHQIYHELHPVFSDWSADQVRYWCKNEEKNKKYTKHLLDAFKDMNGKQLSEKSKDEIVQLLVKSGLVQLAAIHAYDRIEELNKTSDDLEKPSSDEKKNEPVEDPYNCAYDTKRSGANKADLATEIFDCNPYDYQNRTKQKSSRKEKKM